MIARLQFSKVKLTFAIEKWNALFLSYHCRLRFVSNVFFSCGWFPKAAEESSLMRQFSSWQLWMTMKRKISILHLIALFGSPDFCDLYLLGESWTIRWRQSEESWRKSKYKSCNFVDALCHSALNPCQLDHFAGGVERICSFTSWFAVIRHCSIAKDGIVCTDSIGCILSGFGYKLENNNEK